MGCGNRYLTPLGTCRVLPRKMYKAELRAQQLEGILVSSSGIRARIGYRYNGPISWYALRLIQRERLIPFMSKYSRQTTRKGLCSAQLVIFMQPQHITTG